MPSAEASFERGEMSRARPLDRESGSRPLPWRAGMLTAAASGTGTRILAAMGPRRPPQVARGYLGRLVVVTAVLAGLVLLHSPACADSMMPAMAMAPHPSTTSLPALDMSRMETPTEMGAAPEAAPTAVAHHPVDPRGAVSSGPPNDAPDDGRGGAGGVLATCLVFIVAALAALRSTRPSADLSAITVLRVDARPRCARGPRPGSRAIVHPARLGTGVPTPRPG